MATNIKKNHHRAAPHVSGRLPAPRLPGLNWAAEIKKSGMHTESLKSTATLFQKSPPGTHLHTHPYQTRLQCCLHRGRSGSRLPWSSDASFVGILLPGNRGLRLCFLKICLSFFFLFFFLLLFLLSPSFSFFFPSFFSSSFPLFCLSFSFFLLFLFFFGPQRRKMGAGVSPLRKGKKMGKCSAFNFVTSIFTSSNTGSELSGDFAGHDALHRVLGACWVRCLPPVAPGKPPGRR